LYKITGFSLIEQAIIISLLSIIAISLNKYNEKQDFNYKFKETKRRFTVIQLAIEETYLNKIIRNNFHDFLCPGDLSGNVNCINFKFLYKSQILLSGYVPYKSLNLPEYYSYDSWGNKIKYNIDIDALINKDASKVFLFLQSAANIKNRKAIKISEVITVSQFINSINIFDNYAKNFCKLWKVLKSRILDCNYLNNKVNKICL